MRRFRREHERLAFAKVGREKIEGNAAVRFRRVFYAYVVRRALRKVHDLPRLRLDDFVAEHQFAVRLFVVDKSVIFAKKRGERTRKSRRDFPL